MDISIIKLKIEIFSKSILYRRSLVWRREYKGHVPDTAIAAVNSSRRGKETTYFGRAALSKEVVVPGNNTL
jgi:hypothetical protein